MRILNRCLILSLVFLVVSSLIVLAVAPTTVQATSELSVPQIISVKFFDISNDYPPSTTTTINEYTGEKITITEPGYRVTRYSVEVTIRNQPFTLYIDELGREVKRDYVIEFKGPFGEEWKSFGGMYLWTSYSSQPNSEYAVVTYEIGLFWSAGTKVDFRVRAGLCVNTGLQDNWLWEWSDWSSVKTFTVPSLLPSQTANFSPVTSDGNGQPQFPGQTQPPVSIFTNPLFMFGVGAFFVGVVITVVFMIRGRHIKTPTCTNNFTSNSY
jgi:hypothetical protein